MNRNKNKSMCRFSVASKLIWYGTTENNCCILFIMHFQCQSNRFRRKLITGPYHFAHFQDIHMLFLVWQGRILETKSRHNLYQHLQGSVVSHNELHYSLHDISPLPLNRAPADP